MKRSSSITDAARHATALPCPSVGPTPQQWEAVRDEVHRLYVEKELPLRQVKDHLEKNHEFRASERMFKDRLKKWG